MSQSSRGYNEEDDNQDALPLETEDRASTNIRSPDFQKAAPEEEAPPPPAAFGTSMAGPLADFTPTVAADAPEPQNLAGADNPDVQQALDNLSTPAPELRPDLRGGPRPNADRNLRQATRDYDAQQGGIHKYLKSVGVQYAMNPDGSERIDQHPDGAPKFKPQISTPFEEDGRWIIRSRDDKGKVQDVDLLSTKGMVRTDPESGEQYFVKPDKTPQRIGFDQTVIDRRKLLEQRQVLTAQDQAHALQIQKLEMDLAPAKEQYRAMQRGAIGGDPDDSDGPSKSVREHENIIVSLKAGHEAGTLSDRDETQFQTSSGALDRFNQGNPQYAQLGSGIKATEDTVAEMRQQQLRDKARIRALSTDPRVSAAVTSTLPSSLRPDNQPQSPDSVTTGEVATQAVEQAAQQNTTPIRALPRVLQNLKESGRKDVDGKPIDQAIYEANNPPAPPVKAPTPEPEKPKPGFWTNLVGNFLNAADISGAQLGEGVQRLVGATGYAADTAKDIRFAKEIQSGQFSDDNPYRPGGPMEGQGYSGMIDRSKNDSFATGVARAASDLPVLLSGPEVAIPALLGKGASEGSDEAAAAGQSRTLGALKGAGKGAVTLGAYMAGGKLVGPLLGAMGADTAGKVALGRGLAALGISGTVNTLVDATTSAMFGGDFLPKTPAEAAQRFVMDFGFAGHHAYGEAKLPDQVRAAVQEKLSKPEEIQAAHGQIAVINQAQAKMQAEMANPPQDSHVAAKEKADWQATIDFLEQKKQNAQKFLDAQNPRLVKKLEDRATALAEEAKATQPAAEGEPAPDAGPITKQPGQTNLGNVDGLLKTADDLRAKHQTALDAKDNAGAAVIATEMQRVDDQLHEAHNAALTRLPPDLREQLGKTVGQDVDVAGNEAHFAANPKAAFMAAEVGNRLRAEGAYVTPEQDARLTQLAERSGAGPAAEFVADQHIGMQAGKDLARIARGETVDSDAVAHLGKLGLVDFGEKGEIAVTDDGFHLLPPRMMEQLKQAPNSLRVKLTPGSTGDVAHTLIRGGQQRFADAVTTQSRALALREAEHRVAVTFTDSEGNEQTATVPARGTSEDQAVAHAVAKVEAMGNKVSHAEIAKPEVKPEPEPRKVDITSATLDDFTPEEQTAIQQVRAEYRRNMALFRELGLGQFHLVKVDAGEGGHSGLLASKGEGILVDGSWLLRNFKTLERGGVKPGDWAREALVEEVVHGAQFKAHGKESGDFKRHYSDLYADLEKNLPDLLKAAGDAYGGFGELAKHERAAEAERMVLQNRWKGTFTEELFKSVQRVLDYLKGLDTKDSPLLQESIRKTEAVLNEALARAGDVEPTPDRTEKTPAPSKEKQLASHRNTLAKAAEQGARGREQTVDNPRQALTAALKIANAKERGPVERKGSPETMFASKPPEREKLTAEEAIAKHEAFDEHDPETWPGELGKGVEPYDAEDWGTWKWALPESDGKWLDQHARDIAYDEDAGKWMSDYNQNEPVDPSDPKSVAADTIARHIQRLQLRAEAKYNAAHKEAIQRHEDLGDQLDRESFLFASKAPNDTAFDWALQHHGETDDLGQAGYILSDGKLLDFSESRNGGGGSRSLDHRSIQYPGRPSNGGDAMREFMAKGAVRIDANSGAIDIAKAPTREQEAKIRRVLEEANGGVIDLVDGERRDALEATEDSIGKVMGRIRRFYSGEDIESGALFASRAPDRLAEQRAKREQWAREGAPKEEPDQDPAIKPAYDSLVQKTVFPAVSIGHLAEESGIPLEKLKTQILADWKAGKAVLSKGDWSLSDASTKAGVIEQNGDKMVQVRYLPEESLGASKAQTETPEFKRWFGESKAVDGKGAPLVVYHGAPDARFVDDDGAFKTSHQRLREATGKESGPGVFWFTPAIETARSYADDRRAFDYQNAEPGVVPTFIKLENPLIVDAKGQNWRDAQRRGKTSDVIEEARAAGHDGIVIRNVKDDYNNGPRSRTTDTYAVFDANQIKHAERNRGTFDPSDANMLHASPVTDFVKRKVDDLMDGWAAGRQEVSSSGQKREIAQGYDASDNIANNVGEQAGKKIKQVFARQKANNESGSQRKAREAEETKDREAMPFVIEAGLKSLAEQRKDVLATSDPKLIATELPKVDRAIKDFTRLNALRKAHDDLMEEDMRKNKSADISVGEVEHYITRRLDLPDAKKDLLPNPLFQMGDGKGKNPRYFAKGRSFETLSEAIRAGYKPQSTDIAALDQIRIASGEKVRRQKEFFKNLMATKFEGKPIIGEHVDRQLANGKTEKTTPHGYTDVTMGGRPLVVHRQFADLFRNLFGQSAIRSTIAGRALLKFAAVGKHGTLVFDTFHVGRLLYKMASGQGGLPFTIRDGKLAFNYHMGRALIEYGDADLATAVKQGDITADEAKFAKANRTPYNELLAAGLNVGKVSDNLLEQAKLHKIPIISGLNDWIFQKLSRGAMAQTALKFYERNLQRQGITREQAARKTATEMNEYFGNLQNQGIFKSKTLQDLSRLVLLAPNWTESQFRYEARGYGQVASSAINAAKGQGFHVGNSTRAMAVGFAAMLAANQVVNYLSRGKSTFENEEDDHKLDAWVPGGKRGFWFDPFEISNEYMHAGMKYAAQHENPLDAATHIASNKMSPLARGAKEALTGRDYAGRHFLSDADRFRAAAVDALPSPLPASGFVEKDPRAPLGYRMTRANGGMLASLQKQGMQSAGMKVTAAQSPRSAMFAIAQPFRADRGGSDNAAEYSELRRAVDNDDNSGAASEIGWLLSRGKKMEQIQNAMGIHKDGSIHPEMFAGSKEREDEMKASLSQEHRALYRQAQADHVANAKKFRNIAKSPEVRDLIANAYLASRKKGVAVAK